MGDQLRVESVIEKDEFESPGLRIMGELTALLKTGRRWEGGMGT